MEIDTKRRFDRIHGENSHASYYHRVGKIVMSAMIPYGENSQFSYFHRTVRLATEAIITVR